MLDLVEVGGARLPGEVIALAGRVATVQVYAYTGGVRPGDPVVTTGEPLCAELGPGLLGGVYDGMLRRLSGRRRHAAHRASAPGRSIRTGAGRSARCSREGDEATPGAILGEVPESAAITFRALVPHGVAVAIDWIAPAGEYTVSEPDRPCRRRRDHAGAAVAGAAAAARARAPAGRTCPLADRAACARPLLPDRPRELRGGAGRLRHREDGAAPADREVVRRRRDRLRRLRRARQRDGRRARGDGRSSTIRARAARCSTARC